VTTPLKGVDGQIYALAQGNLIVGGAGASANGSKVQINHLSGGRVPAGATVERSVPNTAAAGRHAAAGLHATDFNTARAVAHAINEAKGAGTAARSTAAWCACACRPNRTSAHRLPGRHREPAAEAGQAGGRWCSTPAPARWC
jgi:flagellar basal body P-ring protein FlgI